MKLKRVLAFVLAVCLFVCDIPPVVTAVGDAVEQQPTQVVYDFDLEATYGDQLVDGNFSVEDATNQDFAKGLYDSGEINWLYEGKTNGNSKGDGSGVETQHSRNQYYNSGIRLYSNGHGWWYAIRIKSPGTGTYNVTVNSDTAVSNNITRHSIWTETYLFDAADVDDGVTTIADSLTAANKLTDFKPTVEDTDVELGAYTFTADKEYILVFNETYAIYSEGRDGFDTNNIYLKSLTMALQPDTNAPVVEQQYYDFGLPALNVGIESGGGSSFSADDQKDAVKALYDAGTINWAYEGYTNGNSKSDNSGEVRAPRANTFYSSSYYTNGYGLYLKDHGSVSYNGYYAIRLRAPGVGTYSVTVNSALPPENGGTKHSRWADVYMFDASLLTGEKTVADFLTSAYAKERFAPTLTSLDCNVGEVEFVSDTQEYILVFHLTIDARNSAAKDTRTDNLALNGLTLNYIEPVPEESTTEETTTGSTTTEGTTTEETTAGPMEITGPEMGYSFGVYANYKDYLASGNFGVTDSADALTEMYEKGLIDWLPAGYGGLDEGTSPITRNQWNNTQIQVYSNAHNWYYAIKFRAPGTGTYDFTVNTATVTSGEVQKHSIWTEAYIAEAGSYTAVADILNDDHKIKGFKPTVDAPDAYIGNVSFEEGKEYVLILRETIDTRRDSHKDGLSTDNLYLKGFTFEAAEPPEVEKTGYDFDLAGNYPDDFVTGKTSVDDQTAKIEKFYSNGYIDWMFYGKQNGSKTGDVENEELVNSFNQNALNKGQGIQVYGAGMYGWWYALKFRAKVTGTADITLSTYLVEGKDADGNPIDKHSIWTEAYLIEASELSSKSVDELLDDDHKIKRFAPTVEETDAYLGNVTLTKGKEYIIVLRGTSDLYRQSKATGTQNLYLSGLTVEAAEPPEVEKTGYDFDLAGNYPDDFVTGKTSVDDQTAKIEKFYSNGYIDWMFYGKQNGSKTGDVENEELVNSFNQNALNKGQGIQVYGAGMYGWWYALKFRAKVTGTADITLSTYLVEGKDANGNPIDKHSLWTEAYLIEASELGSKSVDDLLDADHKLKRFAPTVAEPDAYLGNVTLTKGKEYIIVLRGTSDLYRQSKATGTQNLYLSGLTVEAAEPPEVEKTGYDFDLAGNYPDDFTGGKNSVMEQKKKIDEFYEKGYISWRVEAILNGSKTGDVENEEPVNAFSQNALVKGSGIQAYSGAGHNWVYAFRIQSPGKGYHKVTMGTFLTQGKDADGNSVKKHSIWTDVYIIEASQLDNGKITIRDAMLKKYKLGDFQPTVENPDAYIGTFNFEEGKEYILIFRETMKHWQQVKNIGGTLNMYLKGLTFEYTGKADTNGIDPNTTIYDFDLADKLNGIYTGSPKLNDKMDDVSRLYSLEDLNWKQEEIATGSSWKYSGTGVTAYSAPDDYLVYRIKSPGKGLYTLTLNHGKSGRGGTGAVYILPVSEAANAIEATDIHNRVGRVKFYNDNGDVNPSDGYTSLLGTWEFGAAEEYLVVVEAYSVCPYDAATSYMYFSQLVCEKGDVTAKYQAERKASPILISDGPVNTIDVSPFKATGEVNGHDYFYLPLEGKKLNVYDIDAGELVAQVDTPFTTCRGIVVDPDGIVWAVGDNSYIFRYDPFLNVGEDAYYYKRTSADGGSKGDAGIQGSYSGQDVIYAEDGCLYFGVAMGGYFARYEIATGTFTNLGTYGGDAANWSSSPVYHEGVLFGTITGDRNSDGTKTTLLLKMDAKTGDVLETLDLTPYVSQKEVMMRGAGICGGVLLIGGDQNDVKKALAIDIETLEILDINVPGFILGGPTEELDGKVYFTAQAMGIYEFDGATRTATKLEMSDAYMLQMTCHENSFITVEGNEKYPGYSIMSYRTSTNQPVIMNPQTKEFMVLDGVVDDSHGTGNSIQSIAHGVAEEDKDYLYIGVFNNNACSVVDINTGEVINKYETNGQTDTMTFYDGKLFVGNYAQGALVQINIDDKRRNVTLMSLKAEYHQSRVHNVVGGDGKVFFGSVPDWYEYGGCLSWVDLETLERYVERNVVQDQSVIGLAYHDGIVYGGTSTSGGTGSTIRTDLSAKVFLYDVENKKKILEIDPRDYLSLDAEIYGGVNGLYPDPDVENNGIIWGICGGSLFTLQYNKSTGKVKMEEKLCLDPTANGGKWSEAGIMTVGDDLYVNFGSKGGVWRINTKNIADREQLPVAASDKFTIAQDGNYYYAITDNLYMYPLVVADSDYAAAANVDQLLASIAKIIKVEDEAKLNEIQAAYDNLTWTQKSLVQNLYKLEDAKIELLEAKIDSLGEITMEDDALIAEIKAAYNAMSTKDKSYVKNFRTIFVPAMQALQALKDAEAAAKVQALIDTIPGMGEITLEKEAAIREIEAAYNALTKEQKALVDATHLEKALETIKALRQVRIDRLIELIAKLGENITLADEPIIDEAMEIYNWLTMDERSLVDYEKLTLASGALQKLQRAAAAEVDALIEAIGDTVDYSSGDAIAAARAAYDALTEGSKKYVKLLDILEEAEALYAGLFPIWAIVVIVVVAVAAAAAAVVVILRKKKKAAAPAEEASAAEADAPVSDEV